MPLFLPASWADSEPYTEPLEWRWPLWLPAGTLTILAGEPGSGKSALALRLAASFLRGDPWPDGSRNSLFPGAVLWCDSETSFALNLQRALGWGLPVERIFSPLDDPDQNLSFTDPAHIRAFGEKVRLPGLQLVVLDSLASLTGRLETSPVALEIVRSLAQAAAYTRLPVLLIHHLRKIHGTGARAGLQLDRLRGSSVIAQTARMVWALDAPDPLHPAVKRLQVIKSNLAALPPPLAMTIGSTGLQFTPLPQLPQVQSALDQSLALLRDLLASGPLPAAQVEDAFRQAGLSRRQFLRARDLLGVVTTKTAACWMLSLPAPIRSYRFATPL
jgi:putative DNA primase/helicase